MFLSLIFFRYSALFVDEDPDIDLGEGGGGSSVGGRKERGVSITRSGHVHLRQKKAAQGRGHHGGGGARSDGVWASGSSDEEGTSRAGGSRQSTPRKVSMRLVVVWV